MDRSKSQSYAPRALAALLRRPPRARENGKDLMRIEQAIGQALLGGLGAAERYVRELFDGVGLTLVERAKGRRSWLALLEKRRRLELTVTSDRVWRTVSLRYRKEPVAPKLTPRQAKIDALQKAFYARYTEIGAKAYAQPPRRITPGERRLLLVGELEGGVNNGGFSTYLSNKGRRRARETLAALRSIGAVKTARMLEGALAPGITSAELGRLDAGFYRAPEDLAVLAVRCAGK